MDVVVKCEVHADQPELLAVVAMLFVIAVTMYYGVYHILRNPS